ncbi:MAG: MFS transporter [Acidobacteria bacterium]|nr:MFS transporter [Acidobacteriota bacterium]
MTTLRNEMPLTLPWLARLPLYYGWINLIVASLAMVGTLPGRTQGLGLITESLLKDLQLDRVTFAQINLWATLIGALGCLGIGKLIDRFGSRIVVTVVVVALGLTVWLMSNVRNTPTLALLITLTRGFGQSALSVVSITMVGQWFVKRLSAAMASYTVLLSVGFMIAFPVVGAAVINSGWRATWLCIAVALLCILAPLSWWLVRESPEACGVALDGKGDGKAADEPATVTDFTLGQALATPAF